MGAVTVNEEIWDLLTRRARSVDLAFQRVQETLTQVLALLAILADKLVKDATANAAIDRRSIFTHVMDSLLLVSQANWR